MRSLLILFFLFPVAVPLAAQSPAPGSEDDKMLMVRLENVNVVSRRLWENDTVRYQYNQMRYYVTTILPYLEEAVRLFSEIDERLNDPDLDKKARKAFVSAQEELVRTRFEEKIRDLNTTQGVLLVKLIARQTGLNIYQMLNDFKNPVAALKWQAWAKMNGFNLNRKYHPSDEPDLEHIMEGLGYPLPVFYARNE